MMTSIREYNPVTGEAGHCIAVARASVGIYMALSGEHFPAGSRIIVPANLCYAGIFPAVYAGLQPVFCDVDAYTGNVTLETITSVFDPRVVAAIVPHMYGNPVEQMPEIAEFCKLHSILLIEDCASAMGATANNYSLGCVGDYVVYSTGYSKTIDLGFGGFLFSKTRDLSFTLSIEQELPELSAENEQNIAFFSKLYRLMRNSGTGTKIETMICQGLADSCKDDFLHKIDRAKKDWLFDQLRELPKVIDQRRAALAIYEKAMAGTDVQKYPYAEGSVPWRYNLLVNSNIRKPIIDACLVKSIPVSDWYPRVTNLFDVHGEFPGAQMHENMILNFPLLIGEEKIDQICSLLKKTIASFSLEVLP